jgi:hypothetical protein
MNEAKTFIYRYDGATPHEEEETDFSGLREMPRMGDLIYRRRKMWRVMGVYTGYGTVVPRYRVILTHISKTELIQ